jgi:hypothetical protein
VTSNVTKQHFLATKNTAHGVAGAWSRAHAVVARHHCGKNSLIAETPSPEPHRDSKTCRPVVIAPKNDGPTPTGGRARHSTLNLRANRLAAAGWLACSAKEWSSQTITDAGRKTAAEHFGSVCVG